MTHRTCHLADRGLLGRSEGKVDRRNVMCVLTQAGHAFLADSSEDMVRTLRRGSKLAQVDPPRFLAYVHTMGTSQISSLDLCLLGVMVLSEDDETGPTVVGLVNLLGLLQPTVSMSLKTLESRGLLRRGSDGVGLTDEGLCAAKDLSDAIGRLVVPHGLAVN